MNPEHLDIEMQEVLAQFRQAEPRLISKRVRLWLTTMIVISCVLSFVYYVLGQAHLEQTAALFIGLPVLLGLMVIHLTRTRNVWGRTVQANIIFLAIAAPLLGEGAICLLMASPLFIAISLTVVVVVRGFSGMRSGDSLALLFLPFAWGSLEKYGFPPAPEILVVETETLVEGELGDWVRTIRGEVPVLDNDSTFLSLGFPLPVGYEEHGDQFVVHFSRCEGVEGRWLLRREMIENGARFQVLEDSTKMSHWMRFIDSEIEIVSEGNGELWVKQRTRFEPFLSPRAYFVPFQRFAIAETHALASSMWSAALRSELK
ncbi:MAG: hypothetical protein ACI8TQ_000487 [Planctomycetota bacterium]|jgi:hypothetical protein